jgi:hypothetical protein
VTEVLGRLTADDPSAGSTAVPGLYDRLIGSWSIESEWFSRDGSSATASGTWDFVRILGGLGVQDVLGVDGAPPSKLGTTLRCLDASIGAWRVTWAQPAAGEFASLLGRAEGDDIVQESAPERDGPAVRWSFREITGSSFLWLGEVQDDDGTWFLEQRMAATRI